MPDPYPAHDPVTAGHPDPQAFATLLCDWCLDIHERDYVLLFSTRSPHR